MRVGAWAVALKLEFSLNFKEKDPREVILPD